MMEIIGERGLHEQWRQSLTRIWNFLKRRLTTHWLELALLFLYCNRFFFFFFFILKITSYRFSVNYSIGGYLKIFFIPYPTFLFNVHVHCSDSSSSLCLLLELSCNLSNWSFCFQNFAWRFSVGIYWMKKKSTHLLTNNFSRLIWEHLCVMLSLNVFSFEMNILLKIQIMKNTSINHHNVLWLWLSDTNVTLILPSKML